MKGGLHRRGLRGRRARGLRCFAGWVVLVGVGLSALAGCEREARDSAAPTAAPEAAPAAPAQPGARGAGPGPLNVLLITLDTTRADALGAYGQSRPTTPNLDGLARRAVLFEQAYATSPNTLPSHASILTGRMPFAHGTRANAGFRLDASNETLAEVFVRHGYATGAEIAAPVINGPTGLDQGFETYRDLRATDIVRKQLSARVGEQDAEPHTIELEERAGDDISDHGIAFLRTHVDQPFFLWLHYFDPHSFYAPPPPWNSRFADAPYFAEVHFTDYQVGRVLAALRHFGLAERTLVVVTADHGEGLGEHGELTHSFFVYDSTMRVPLLISGPGIDVPRRIAEPVRSVDIAPTLLELAGLPPLEGVQGVSLAGVLRDGGPMPELRAYGETLEPFTLFGSSVLRFLRKGPWKYVRKVNPELFHIASDPTEQTNLAAREPQRLEAMERELRQWVLSEAIDVSGSRVHVDEETLQQLVALGYAGTNAPATFSDEEDLGELRPPDPTLMQEDLALYSAAWGTYRAGAYDEAARLFEQAVRRHPSSAPMLWGLAWSLSRAERADEAIAALRRLTEVAPEMVAGHASLGKLLADRGELDEAETHLRKALEIDPCHASARLMLGLVSSWKGDPHAHAALLAQGIASCDTSLDFRNDYAFLLATSPDPSIRDGRTAVEIASKVVEENGRERPDYLDTLACAWAEVGNYRRAAEIERLAIEQLAKFRVPEAATAEYREHLAAFERGEKVVAKPPRARGS